MQIKLGFCSLLLALALSGCATTPSTQSDAQAAIASIQVVVPTGVAYAVMKDPKAAAYCSAAASVIEVMVATNTLSPTDLLTSLAGIDPSLETPEAKLAVMAGVGIYSTYYAQQVQSDENTVRVLKALASAIRQGLATNPTSSCVRRTD